jgi:hypothetical protein
MKCVKNWNNSSHRKENPMKKSWFTPTGILLTLFLSVATSQNAQDVPSDGGKSHQLRRQLAISLLRQVNTAEVVEESTYGSFSSWQTLQAHHAPYFSKFIAMHRQELPNMNFADPPEILPGWSLRLNVHADGQGYDLLLQDMTDKKCGYAAVTDENVIIRQSKWIDCEI